MKRKLRILIVDDEALNIFALKLTLKARGYECLSTQSGADALGILKNEKDIGIILLDMMMPEMDGYEMLQQIRENKLIPESTPVIAVTAQAMTGDKERCLAAGADGYISKPIDVDQLLKILETYE